MMVLFPDALSPLVATSWAPTTTPTATYKGLRFSRGSRRVMQSACFVGLKVFWIKVAHHA